VSGTPSEIKAYAGLQKLRDNIANDRLRPYKLANKRAKDSGDQPQEKADRQAKVNGGLRAIRYSPADFNTLMRGEWEKGKRYPSQSEADLALCTLLAYKHNGDEEKIDQEFRESGLYRDKWERDGYRESTIKKAIESYERRKAEEQAYEQRKAVGQAQEQPESEPQFIRKTDGGNATRLARQHGENFRYLEDKREWRAWDGKRWKPGAESEIQRAAKSVVDFMYQEVATIDDLEERDELSKWARTSDSRKGREGMIALARFEPGICSNREAFDKDPMLLNVQNGTLDLRTLTLREHRREDTITKLIPINYNPGAKCPRWLQFLEETFPGQPEVIEFLQRSLGYTLTGRIDEQCFWLLIGQGNNGKSKFLDAIQHVLSDYATPTSFNTFALQKGGTAAINPRDGLASLEGARFVRASESDQGRQISEALLKALTGGEQVRTARMYAEDYAYMPTYKIWLSTNHEPTIKGTDDGIWRRIHRVNFDTVVPEAKRDPQILDKFIAEDEGILAWVIEGLEKYLRDGLRVPEKVRRATKEYRTSQDVVAQFLAEMSEADKHAETKARALFEAYKRWAELNGERPMTQTRFGAEVSKRYKRTHKTAGDIYAGMRLKD
jgi:putative DNA primase/helicase